jgi:aminoglycoside phosphotransferase (APT) family kinase protein
MIVAKGVRIGWAELPAHVRAAVEQRLGAPVVEAVSQSGGFSPGSADRVVTATGARAFVKTASPALNIHSFEIAKREARIAPALPPDAPVPRWLGTYADDEWIALILEDIDGRNPRTPWVEDEVDAAVTGLRKLAETLTPAPVPGAPTAADNLRFDLAAWRRLADDPATDLNPWAAAHLGPLGAAADRGLAALVGNTLNHCDVRADNMLLRPDGSVVFVDWPWACIGPAWLDTVLLAVNVIVHGGDGDRVLAGVDPAVATDLAAGLCGYFLDVGRRPAPPGLPTVRAFQRAQGEALIPWLRERLPV